MLKMSNSHIEIVVTRPIWSYIHRMSLLRQDVIKQRKTQTLLVCILTIAVVIGWLIENDHDDITMTPKEYLQMYQRPFDVTLAGGRYCKTI